MGFFVSGELVPFRRILAPGDLYATLPRKAADLSFHKLRKDTKKPGGRMTAPARRGMMLIGYPWRLCLLLEGFHDFNEALHAL